MSRRWYCELVESRSTEIVTASSAARRVWIRVSVYAQRCGSTRRPRTSYSLPFTLPLPPRPFKQTTLLGLAHNRPLIALALARLRRLGLLLERLSGSGSNRDTSDACGMVSSSGYGQYERCHPSMLAVQPSRSICRAGAPCQSVCRPT